MSSSYLKAYKGDPFIFGCRLKKDNVVVTNFADWTFEFSLTQGSKNGKHYDNVISHQLSSPTIVTIDLITADLPADYFFLKMKAISPIQDVVIREEIKILIVEE